MANTLFDKIWDAHVVQKVEEGLDNLVHWVKESVTLVILWVTTSV